MGMEDARIRDPGRWWHFPATVMLCLVVAIVAFVEGKTTLAVAMIAAAVVVLAVSGTALRKQLRERS